MMNCLYGLILTMRTIDECLIQTARIAAEIGNEDAKNTILGTIQGRLENWLTANSNEVAFILLQ